MTPEQGYAIAQYQRPGVKIIMGATEAREERIAPLTSYQASKLPGAESWGMHDLIKRLGYRPSFWAQVMAAQMALFSGRGITDDEWQWLAKKSTGLKQVGDWIKENATP